MSRKTELEGDIRVAYHLICHYDAIIAETTDKLARAYAQRDRKYQQNLINIYWDEYQQSFLDDIPPDIVTITNYYAAESIQRPSVSSLTVPQNEKPLRHRGLIALVSKGRADKIGKPQAAEEAILYHIGDKHEPTTTQTTLSVTTQGLPSALKTRLFNTLQRCRAFEDGRVFKAHFTDERLALWRDRVPAWNTLNVNDRIRVTVAYLSEQFNTKQENGLALLLNVLGDDFDAQDTCHQEMHKLAQELDSCLRPHPTVIEEAHLTHCWLVATPKPDGSEENAEQLQRLCAEYGVNAKICLVKDYFDFYETYQCVRKIYTHDLRDIPLSPQQVIADFTGGVKTMTTGLILACIEMQSPMQYMYGDRDRLDSEPRLVAFESHLE